MLSNVPVFVVLSLLCSAMPATAQTVTGTVQGTVTDTSGGVMPGVTITLTQTETNAERVIVTNENGFYSAPFLPIGHYSVKAVLQGFGPVTRQGISLGLNDTRVVDIRLDPRAAESVTVTADAPPINLTNAEVKGALSAEQIMDKPTLSASSFLSLAETFTGFQDNPTSGQNNPTASSGSSINFNGTGTRGATFQINGVNNDDSSENQNRQGASLSTIQEFQVLKNGYSAEFGRGDGAVVLVQTKSGTNKLHGDAYNYQQEGAWNAKSFFAATSPKPIRHRSEYGATAGFPILAKRLFAFGSVDRTKSDGENNYLRDLILAGDASGPWLTRGNDTPANRAFIQSVLDRFAGLAPNDSRSERTYAGVAPFNFPDQDYTGRADWNMARGNTLNGRYQWTRQIRDPKDVIVGEQAFQKNTQKNLGVTWTRVMGSRMVGEARYGLGVRSTNVDIASGNDTPIIRFTASPVSGSIIGNAGNFPIHRDQTDHQFVYNLTAQAFRNHSFKTGVDLRRQALDDLADNFSRGFWTFNRVCGGVTYATPYAAFFDGCVQTFTKAYGPFFLENRMNEANVYGQDDWRVSNALTLNLGLRYEYVGAPSEVEKRIDYIFGADTNNIEPRLGFAYVPKWDKGMLRALTGGSDRFSIRGGWGIYDGRIFQSIFSQGGANVRFNPPNALSRTTTTLPDILNLADPSNGFVFVPGPQTGRVSLTLPAKDLEMPSTTKWHLSVDRVLPFKSTITITYQGNHNDKRLKYALDNLPVSPLTGPVTVVNHPNNAPAAGFPDLRGKTITHIAADYQCAGTGFLPGINPTAACPNAVPLGDDEISLRVPRTNERRPNPLYTNNLLISNDAESWYDGLEIEWRKLLTHGLQFQAAYTYSKAVDTTSEATFVGTGDTNQNGPNSRFAKGPSRFDTPHRFTFNGSYRLPFFSGRTDLVGQVLAGWQLSGVVRMASGTPFSIIDSTAARDLDFDGFGDSIRPVLLDPSILNRHITDPNGSQLSRTAFRAADPAIDSVADLVPRNSFYTPGTKNVDLGLTKNFLMPWQGQSVALRIEAYNAFNTVKFGFPVNDITNVNFGKILGGATSYSPRVIQIVVRYRY